MVVFGRIKGGEEAAVIAPRESVFRVSKYTYPLLHINLQLRQINYNKCEFITNESLSTNTPPQLEREEAGRSNWI